jgi:hypothetical protein
MKETFPLPEPINQSIRENSLKAIDLINLLYEEYGYVLPVGKPINKVALGELTKNGN